MSSFYSHPQHTDFGRLSSSFDDFDQKPAAYFPIYMELACCGHTIPEEVAWSGNGRDADYPELGEVLPCPYCGQLSAVTAKTNRFSPPRLYSIEGQDPVTLPNIVAENDDLTDEHLEALNRLTEGEETYIGIVHIACVSAA